MIRLQDDDDRTYEWSVGLQRGKDPDFTMSESVRELHLHENRPPTQLLEATDGHGWWWSAENRQVELRQPPTSCALAAAQADAAFPAGHIARFISNWGFFDPNPFSLRRGWPDVETERLDPYGRNLAERLYRIKEASPELFERIVEATRAVLGLPTDLEPREPLEGRYYFAQREPGLLHQVHQIGTSSGTLRMLALMTALFEDTGGTLIGIEEPENHIHPTALSAFAEFLANARQGVQILVTTHSPLLLDYLDQPQAVCVVRRTAAEGTRVYRERDPNRVHEALAASGFRLGEFHETKGFGG